MWKVAKMALFSYSRNILETISWSITAQLLLLLPGVYRFWILVIFIKQLHNQSSHQSHTHATKLQTFKVDFAIAVRIKDFNDALYKWILLKFRQWHELINAQWTRAIQVQLFEPLPKPLYLLRIDCKSIIITIIINSRAVPDLLLRNPAGAGFCRICKANPAGAGAGFHHIISHQ